MSLAQQTLTRNGVTITFPLAYASLESYLTTLELNVKVMKGRPGRYAALLELTRTEIERVKQALA